MPNNTYVKAQSYGKSGVLYETADGEKFLHRGGTRTWRNNNPGNLVSGAVSKETSRLEKQAVLQFFQVMKLDTLHY